MTSRVGTPFVMEMRCEETLGGRLAKLPFGIMFIIVLTGALSYYFERRQPTPTPAATTAEAVIQQTITQRQTGLGSPKDIAAPAPGKKWFLLGGAAVVLQGVVGVFAFKLVRRRQRNNRQRRGRL